MSKADGYVDTPGSTHLGAARLAKRIPTETTCSLIQLVATVTEEMVLNVIVCVCVCVCDAVFVSLKGYCENKVIL